MWTEFEIKLLKFNRIWHEFEIYIFNKFIIRIDIFNPNLYFPILKYTKIDKNRPNWTKVD